MLMQLQEYIDKYNLESVFSLLIENITLQRLL